MREDGGLMSRWRLRRREDPRRESGAAAVETALLLSFIVLPLTFAILSYGYMFSFRQALSQATAEGARSVLGATTAAEAQTAARGAVTRALVSYGVVCTPAETLTRTSDGGAPTTVGTCRISETDTSCGDAECMTVTVTYDYRNHPMLPLPGLGWALPPELSFTSVVETS